MDRKTIAAVAVCLAFLVAYPWILRALHWDRFMASSTPARTAAVTAAGDSARAAVARAADSASRAGRPLSSLTGVAPGSSPAPIAAVIPAKPAAPTASAATVREQTYVIETPLYRATFTNRGARLLSVDLLRFRATDPAAHASLDHAGDAEAAAPTNPPPVASPHVVLAGDPSFGLDLGSGAHAVPLGDVAYAAAESLDAAGMIRTLAFTAQDPSGFTVRQTWRVRPEDYALDLAVEITGVPDQLHVTDYTLTARSWPLVTESNQLADERSLKASSMVGTNIHRDHPNQLAKSPRSYDGNAVWAVVQSRYFLGGVAVVNADTRGANASDSKRTVSAAEMARLGRNAKPEADVLSCSLVSALPGREHPVHRYLVYFGPADYFRLAALKLDLERAVDMGWNWILPFSKLLLILMKWLESVLKNYGLAILALATLVRVVLHPLNVTGMKSMRAMQKLQPEIERIREKYKNDPQALNTATMALYKDNNVNPASGCLPMLVQMPLFLALYQVLFNAIELRRAPFVAWMQDLSAPDLAFTVMNFPIRVLPVLMAGSGLLQQMFTPTDPRQRPTMYMMNVMMLAFFYNLPSGLVLYWTVMNLLTAVQQWMVLRQDGGSAATVVVAPATGKRR